MTKIYLYIIETDIMDMIYNKKSNKTLENSNFFNNGKKVRILMIITLSFSLLFMALCFGKAALGDYLTLCVVSDLVFSIILFTLTLVSYILITIFHTQLFFELITLESNSSIWILYNLVYILLW